MAVLGLSIFFVVGCSDDDDDNPASPGDESIFTDYRDWNQVEHTNTPNDILGPAHQGNNPEFTRSIYTSAGSMIDTGEYPEGTKFVKETHTYDNDANHEFADPMGLLGMVKREAGFDEAGNDWEYFNIDPEDLSTIASGADLGACKGCHTLATEAVGTDFIFSHPYEFEADGSDFDDYAAWNLIGTETGPDALIGDAHAGNDANAVRKIYKKQLAANPDGLGDGYPTGTMILKTVEDEGGTLIGRTGMAKRGNGFDPDNGDWEYFMWNPDNGDVVAQGAVAMCIGCHSQATTATNGRDFVFKHDGDPFNN